MKLYSGKRIGQSGQELGTAVSFSLFLHVVFFLAAFLLFTVTPRTFMPPFYSVKLVGLPSEQSGPLQGLPGGQPLAEQKQPKLPEPPKPKTKKSSERRPAAEKKNNLPDLASVRPRQEKSEPANDSDEEQSSSPEAGQPGAAAPAGASREGVAVGTSQEDFKYGWYLARIRDKIGQNWKPPEDTKDAKCRVVFSINRSGWVGDVNLVSDVSNGSFGFKQAAVRAVRASNPFPPLPEEFSKQTLEFTVDLMAID